MDLIPAAALAGGLAWASGLRLYAVLFAAGLLGRLGYLQLPEQLTILQAPWMLAITASLLSIEFLADKIPFVDSAWDSLQTFSRIPAGAGLAALAMGQHDPALTVAAGLLGGTLTAGTHALKAGSRALINTSPEPVSNIVASLGEEGLLVAGLYTAFFHSVAFLLLLTIFVATLIWILPKLLGSIVALLRRLVDLFSRLFRATQEPAAK
jgi:hypothetical protein